ncbi:hypothetical protein IMX26_09570 [Clostridium sp. 'deep sea']|uniref:hypothetical protein n=1 Tax=Clostridium sp. 'deep sea' TaxID=2779445 RepID=UPI0018964830|nr:hypothetical protein [Clostridium sp. 'deep sea']QOR33750.1 hypothetical protein IMX26_09570 [Clostridium sp. 'deep sea']
MVQTIGTWIAALGTLGLMSFAIKENPFYRVVEHVYVGVAAAHSLVMGWESLNTTAFTPITQGEFLKIIPLVIGVLLFARFFKGQMWLSRYPLAILVGIGTGLTIKGTISAQIIDQVQASIKPLNTLNNVIIFVGLLSVLMFFYFTRKNTNKLFNVSSKIGRYIMMIAFGALFGNAVMGRMSLMIGRVQFLLGEWLGLLG